MKNKNIYKNQATLISIPHNYRPRVFCVKKTKKNQNEKISETKKQSKLLFRSLFQAKKKKKMSIQIHHGINVTREMHRKFFEDLKEHHGIDITNHQHNYKATETASRCLHAYLVCDQLSRTEDQNVLGITAKDTHLLQQYILDENSLSTIITDQTTNKADSVKQYSTDTRAAMEEASYSQVLCIQTIGGKITKTKDVFKDSLLPMRCDSGGVNILSRSVITLVHMKNIGATEVGDLWPQLARIITDPDDPSSKLFYAGLEQQVTCLKITFEHTGPGAPKQRKTTDCTTVGALQRNMHSLNKEEQYVKIDPDSIMVFNIMASSDERVKQAVQQRFSQFLQRQRDGAAKKTKKKTIFECRCFDSTFPFAIFGAGTDLRICASRIRPWVEAAEKTFGVAHYIVTVYADGKVHQFIAVAKTASDTLNEVSDNLLEKKNDGVYKFKDNILFFLMPPMKSEGSKDTSDKMQMVNCNHHKDQKRTLTPKLWKKFLSDYRLAFFITARFWDSKDFSNLTAVNNYYACHFMLNTADKAIYKKATDISKRYTEAEPHVLKYYDRMKIRQESSDAWKKDNLKNTIKKPVEDWKKELIEKARGQGTVKVETHQDNVHKILYHIGSWEVKEGKKINFGTYTDDQMYTHSDAMTVLETNIQNSEESNDIVRLEEARRVIADGVRDIKLKHALERGDGQALLGIVAATYERVSGEKLSTEQIFARLMPADARGPVQQLLPAAEVEEEDDASSESEEDEDRSHRSCLHSDSDGSDSDSDSGSDSGSPPAIGNSDDSESSDSESEPVGEKVHDADADDQPVTWGAEYETSEDEDDL